MVAKNQGVSVVEVAPGRGVWCIQMLWLTGVPELYQCGSAMIGLVSSQFPWEDPLLGKRS